MRYMDIVAKNNFCPFCKDFEKHYLDENELACVFVARAAYRKGHILICPKDHIEYWTNLNVKQRKDLNDLIFKWQKIIEKNFWEYIVFVREWKQNWTTWKTVAHLHWHIVPNFQVLYHEKNFSTSRQHSSDNRHYFSDQEYEQEIFDLKKLK